MNKENCPAYQTTVDVSVRCFITGKSCNYNDYFNCPEYNFHLNRIHNTQKQNDLRINSQPSRIPNIAQNITDAIDNLDIGVRKSLMKYSHTLKGRVSN